MSAGTTLAIFATATLNKSKAPKTVNNVLTVLNVLLKQAVAWGVLARVPCAIRRLSVSLGTAGFHEFDAYDRLVGTAKAFDAETHLIVLSGGDAGLRCGEMIALEWRDIHLERGHLCVARSDWNSHVTTPKGGRARAVRLTARLAAALRDHRSLRSPRVLCQANGRPLTRHLVQYWVKRAARRANVPEGVHRLRHHADSRIMPSACSVWRWSAGCDDVLSLVRSA